MFYDRKEFERMRDFYFRCAAKNVNCDELRQDNLNLIALVEQMDCELRKFYYSDGSYDLMPTIDSALERRKDAAKTLDTMNKI